MVIAIQDAVFSSQFGGCVYLHWEVPNCFWHFCCLYFWIMLQVYCIMIMHICTYSTHKMGSNTTLADVGGVCVRMGVLLHVGRKSLYSSFWSTKKHTTGISTIRVGWGWFQMSLCSSKWRINREAQERLNSKSRKVVPVNNFKHTKTTKSIATKQVAG